MNSKPTTSTDNAAPKLDKVNPFGGIESVGVKVRFPILGNRGGILGPEWGPHGTQWRTKTWIACVAAPSALKAPRPDGFRPQYTHLYFLDEATSLASGHRPCAACRHAQFKAFAKYWAKVWPVAGTEVATVKAIDTQLHRERLASSGGQPYPAELATLPSGTFVVLRGHPCLVWKGNTYRWSMTGYGSGEPFEPGAKVGVITPKSIVEVFKLGYLPEVGLPSS